MTGKYDELYARCEKAVDARLSGKRLAHVHSVADYAAQLAQVYGVDADKARLAGILHDWDKLIVDDEFPARYAELGMELPERYELMWPVLHSFTGAAAVKREFPELPDDVVQAISRHTLGGADMDPLDMVVFVADLIEPLRNAEKRRGVKELREMVGKASLEELYFATYMEVMHALIARKRFIHPEAFGIWNELVARYADHSRQKENQGNPDVVL